MFPLNQEKMLAALEDETALLAAEGVPAAVRMAYLMMAPLLWEEKAIAAHVREHPGLWGALPNVVDVGEAVLIAAKEWRLTEPHQKQLATLLETPPQ